MVLLRMEATSCRLPDARSTSSVFSNSSALAARSLGLSSAHSQGCEVPNLQISRDVQAARVTPSCSRSPT